ncbi:MAG: tetratricopeptide repeat protein [Bdellovibrionota bacterium]
MQKIKKEFMTYLRRDDLLQAALVLGKIEDPSYNHRPFINLVLALAAQVLESRRDIHNDPILLAKRINTVLFEEFGLQGKSEDYKHVIDDANQYYLNYLLEKKKGGPLSYATLYTVLAQQVGLDCEVLAFPSHYFLRIRHEAGEFFVNPFEKGKFLSGPEFQRKFKASLQRNRLLSAKLFEVLDTEQLVARIAQQLKHVYILKSSSLKALRAIEILSAIYPDSPELTRDRGILYCEMEYFSKAREDLRSYLKARPKAEDVREIKKLALMLRGYSETMN